MSNESVYNGMEIKLTKSLPQMPEFIPGIRRAPKRELTLSNHEMTLALKNALRYFMMPYTPPVFLFQYIPAAI